MKWWVTKGDRKPIGPVTTELLLQGIEANMVPRDAFVCEVGGPAWHPIDEMAPFAAAFAELRRRRRARVESDRTVVDPPSAVDFLSPFEEGVEKTKVEQSPLLSSDPPARPWLERFDDSADKTIVDHRPLRSSDPPPDR